MKHGDFDTSALAPLIRKLMAAAEEDERRLEALAAALLYPGDNSAEVVTLATELVGVRTKKPISPPSERRTCSLNNKTTTQQ